MPNPYRLRCPECRTRRTDPHSMVLHVLQCKRPLCNCGGYPYAHRPTSGECHLNPEAQMRRALQLKLPEDDALDVAADVAFSIPGKPMKAWPFDGKKEMKESQIENYLVQRVKELGGEVRKVQWGGRRGAPDRLVMLPLCGRYGRNGTRCTLWVELKSPETVKTFPADGRERAQAREHERMRKCGQWVEVIGTLEQVDEVLA